VLVLVARPALWLTNIMAYGFLRLFGVVRAAVTTQTLSAEELRTVVTRPRPVIPRAATARMLLSILDLGRVTVNDIMIPRQEISGIDVSESWEAILDQDRPRTRSQVDARDLLPWIMMSFTVTRPRFEDRQQHSAGAARE